MKKTPLILLIAIVLTLNACAKDEGLGSINSSMSQLIDNLPSSEEAHSVEDFGEIDFEGMLIDTIGAAYFEGRAFMRADDEEINGETCAVFQVGSNNNEHFTTEEWLAVSQNSTVYKYDVALDEWSGFSPNTAASYSPEAMQNCIYALNEIYSDEYSAEFYDTADMVKTAVYESEDAFNDNAEPIMLIGQNDTVPVGYFADPIGTLYMPVYNFNSKAEIYEHFSNYFTENFINEIRPDVDRNFCEFDGELYLTRGSMGYGAYNVDFDSIDYSNIQDNTLIINTLYFGEPDGKVRIKFAQENGRLKIDKDVYILMYELHYLSPSFEFIEVPDFSAFTSENYLPTPYDEFVADETSPDTYRATYLGDYYEYLPDYADILKLIGFNVIIDGYEGFYSFEKYADDYLLTVNAYYMNEQDGVVVEVSRQVAVG